MYSGLSLSSLRVTARNETVQAILYLTDKSTIIWWNGRIILLYFEKLHQLVERTKKDVSLHCSLNQSCHYGFGFTVFTDANCYRLVTFASHNLSTLHR